MRLPYSCPLHAGNSEGSNGRFETSRGTLTIALAGLPGPALLTLAYLIAGPGSGAARYQLVPYWAAMTATGAGVLGSVLAAVVRRSDRLNGGSPTLMKASGPAGRNVAAGEPAEHRRPAGRTRHAAEPPARPAPERKPRRRSAAGRQRRQHEEYVHWVSGLASRHHANGGTHGRR